MILKYSIIVLYRKYQYFEKTTEWKRTLQKASGRRGADELGLIRIARL